ncbi:dTDP-4-dehydrorhamnose reductase [Fodinibius sediminis]|uniref:dTDP-4-dehydrorhamnose reductase n=1 Tax=Fodinibius sediminis TaxID=1214077 RepID=A0A521BXJ8_9BACT|nr:dTDP-4-dehydrorhamnose reductase [Fodinibius sediminis]SMO51301.1 dTDP-4-dehydrorhamnose reductase [Fodinibius sediminis]
MMIILLGAGGQLGREWQHFLERSGEEQYDFIPYSSSDLDITRSDELAAELEKRQADVVINCAAYTNVDGAEKERERARKVNAGAVSQLAELSTVLGFKLIHYSTDYVFPGRAEDRSKYPQGYGEDHPAAPVNFYGQTKWEGEQAIRAKSSNFLVLRVSWLCGAYGANFIKTMLKLGRERKALQVVNDQLGSPTFTSSVVQHSWTLLQGGHTGTFHSTSGGLLTWYDLAKSVFEEEEMEVEVEAVSSDAFPTAARRPRFSKLNTGKIASLPGCEIIDWKEGLRRMLEQL